MAVGITHSNEYPTYFITFTCYRWISLFEITQGYDLVYRWFRYLRDKQSTQVVAYVIMPNHFHGILHMTTENFNLNTMISEAKRFMAYDLLKRLRQLHDRRLLGLLEAGVSPLERGKGQIHKVFERSFDAKPLYTQPFFEQKLNYIHHNPVQEHWQLVEDYTDYEHSSASYYERQEVKHFEPTHYLDL